MAQQIYKSFYGNPRESWYQLSKAEQDSLLQKVTAARDKVGGKSVILCSSWSSDAYQFFGVEVFPSLEAVHEHNKLLNELNWFRYLDGFSLLGTEET